jgi:hypothetical protein
MDIGEIVSLSVMGLLALERIVNRKPSKDFAEIKQHCKETREILEVRKEENSITLDATEAVLDAVMKGKPNGKCDAAMTRIKDYRNKCLEHRL